MRSGSEQSHGRRRHGSEDAVQRDDAWGEGFSFDIDAPPPAGIRVEFPTVATEPTAGEAIWKPSHTYALSPLVAGRNVLLFADLASASYITAPIPFDAKTLLSVQFLVPAFTAASATYDFCISNLAAITLM